MSAEKNQTKKVEDQEEDRKENQKDDQKNQTKDESGPDEGKTDQNQEDGGTYDSVTAPGGDISNSEHGEHDKTQDVVRHTADISVVTSVADTKSHDGESLHKQNGYDIWIRPDSEGFSSVKTLSERGSKTPGLDNRRSYPDGYSYSDSEPDPSPPGTSAAEKDARNELHAVTMETDDQGRKEDHSDGVLLENFTDDQPRGQCPEKLRSLEGLCTYEDFNETNVSQNDTNTEIVLHTSSSNSLLRTQHQIETDESRGEGLWGRDSKTKKDSLSSDDFVEKQKADQDVYRRKDSKSSSASDLSKTKYPESLMSTAHCEMSTAEPGKPPESTSYVDRTSPSKRKSSDDDDHPLQSFGDETQAAVDTAVQEKTNTSKDVEVQNTKTEKDEGIDGNVGNTGHTEGEKVGNGANADSELEVKINGNNEENGDNKVKESDNEAITDDDVFESDNEDNTSRSSTSSSSDSRSSSSSSGCSSSVSRRGSTPVSRGSSVSGKSAESHSGLKDDDPAQGAVDEQIDLSPRSSSRVSVRKDKYAVNSDNRAYSPDGKNHVDDKNGGEKNEVLVPSDSVLDREDIKAVRPDAEQTGASITKEEHGMVQTVNSDVDVADLKVIKQEEDDTSPSKNADVELIERNITEEEDDTIQTENLDGEASQGNNGITRDDTESSSSATHRGDDDLNDEDSDRSSPDKTSDQFSKDCQQEDNDVAFASEKVSAQTVNNEKSSDIEDSPESIHSVWRNEQYYQTDRVSVLSTSQYGSNEIDEAQDGEIDANQFTEGGNKSTELIEQEKESNHSERNDSKSDFIEAQDDISSRKSSGISFREEEGFRGSHEENQSLAYENSDVEDIEEGAYVNDVEDYEKEMENEEFENDDGNSRDQQRSAPVYDTTPRRSRQHTARIIARENTYQSEKSSPQDTKAYVLRCKAASARRAKQDRLEAMMRESPRLSRRRTTSRRSSSTVRPQTTAAASGKAEDDKTDSNKSSRSAGRAKSARPSTKGDNNDDGRSKQKEFFRVELKRLEKSLTRESSKIHKPQVRSHYPYVFNNLEPYYNTYTAKYLIYLPEEVRHGYVSRSTAGGLTDPWEDLRMDRTVLPRIESRPVTRADSKRGKRSSSGDKRPPKEGSTRLPKFPVVTLETADIANKQLYFSDVPMLREELKQKYSANAKQKIDADYERTTQDYYRMELDKMDEIHPVNRPHMRKAYFAYLQNTPGSKKAIYSCVKKSEKATQ